MLVLDRSPGQRVVMLCPGGEDIRVKVVEVRGKKVVLGFDAPRSVQIHREEVQLAIEAQGDTHGPA